MKKMIFSHSKNLSSGLKSFASNEKLSTNLLPNLSRMVNAAVYFYKIGNKIKSWGTMILNFRYHKKVLNSS